MSDVGSELSHDIGPFPLGVWLVIGAGGVALGLYARKHFGAASATTDTTATDTTTAGGTNTDTAGNLYQPTSNSGGSMQQIGTPSYANNETWRIAAEQILLGHNYNPTLIDSAISKYLTGGTLSQAEQALVDFAIQYAGPTPDQVPTPVIDQTPMTPVTGNPAPTTNNTQTTPTTDTTAVTAAPAPSPATTPATVAPSQANNLPAGTAVQVANPVAGDSSTVVVGKNADGTTYVYGGTQAQADLLGANNAPPVAPTAAQTGAPNTPVQLAPQQALPAATGVGQKYITPDGFTFTYG